MSKSQAVQTGKKGRQDYETPDLFYQLCHREFKFSFDLAAHRLNHKHKYYFGPGSKLGEDSLDRPWHKIRGWCWLNPPFGYIRPWARKCLEEAEKGAQIAMLTLASTGSNWFHEYCWGKCEIRFLNGRLKFTGQPTPFPKDLALYVYSPLVAPANFVWDWRTDTYPT